MIKSHQEKNQEEAVQAAKLAAGAVIYSNLFGSKKELRNNESELEDLRREYYELKSKYKKLKKENESLKNCAQTYDCEVIEDDSDSDVKKFGMFILNTIKFLTAFVLMSVLILILI